MSDGRTHRITGTLTGAITANLRAQDQSAPDRLLETLGGALAAHYGATIVDRLEPATSPNHRSVCHSLVGAALTAVAVEKVLDPSIAWCREHADQWRARSAAEADPVQSLLMGLIAIALRMLAGGLNGLVAGHASHLALDSTTAKGLPLVVAGDPALSFAQLFAR